jgi:hypothetical protein
MLLDQLLCVGVVTDTWSATIQLYWKEDCVFDSDSHLVWDELMF